MKQQPIGVIDSGVGGLTVAKEIMRQLPNEKIIYLGDTARCPYGPRTAQGSKKVHLGINNLFITKKHQDACHCL